MGVSFEKYMDDATKKILALSEIGISEKENQKLIDGLTSEIQDCIVTGKEPRDYDLLLDTISISCIDKEIDQLMRKTYKTESDYSSISNLCARQEKLFEEFKNKNWSIPKVLNKSIDEIRSRMKQGIENDELRENTLRKYRIVSNKLIGLNVESTIIECDEVVILLKELENYLIDCRSKGVSMPEIAGYYTKKELEKIQSLKSEITEKNTLKKEIVRLDVNINNEIANSESTIEEKKRIISLCKEQKDNLRDFKNKNWAVPLLSCSNPDEVIARYSDEISGFLSSQFSVIYEKLDYLNGNSSLSDCEEVENLINEFGPIVKNNEEFGFVFTYDEWQTKASAMLTDIEIFKAEILEREELTSKVLDLDKEINSEDSKNTRTIEEWENLISLCEQQEGYLEKFEEHCWNYPELSAFDIDSIKEKYSKYIDVTKKDIEISYQLSRLDTPEDIGKLIDLCNSQSANLDYIQIQGWLLPPLTNRDFEETIRDIEKTYKKNQAKKKIKKFFFKVLATIVALIILVVGITIYSRMGKVKVSYSSQELKGQNYQKVAEELKEDGFENIKLVESKDGISIGGETLSVTIGNESTFKQGEYLEADNQVIIKYTSIDRINVEKCLQDYKEKEYRRIENDLKSMGITGIELKTEVPKNKKDNHKVSRITINNCSYNSGECYVPKDAKAEITYYEQSIKMTKDYSDIDSDDYNTLKKYLSDLGFSNIKLKRGDNLKIGLFANEGTVKSFSIKGKTSFKKGDSFNFDDEIIITVNTFKGKGCEEIK